MIQDLIKALESPQQMKYYVYANLDNPNEILQDIKDYAQSKEPDRMEIASRVMAGMCANSSPDQSPIEKWDFNILAVCAVQATDVLINELKK